MNRSSSCHLHILAREPVKQHAVQLMVTQVILKKGVNIHRKQSIYVQLKKILTIKDDDRHIKDVSQVQREEA